MNDNTVSLGAMEKGMSEGQPSARLQRLFPRGDNWASGNEEQSERWIWCGENIPDRNKLHRVSGVLLKDTEWEAVRTGLCPKGKAEPGGKQD